MARTPAKRYDSSATWWGCTGDENPGDECHDRLFRHVQAIEESQEDVHYQNVLNAQLYTNREPMTFGWRESGAVSFRPLNANLENVIQSVIDTVISLLGKNRPKATPVARGADFDVYLRTRLLDRFLWGEFVEQKIWDKGVLCLSDALVYGTGFLKVGIDGGEVYTERVNPDEIVVDQRECVSTAEPTQLFQRKLVSRLWLLQTYGTDEEKRRLINEAQRKEFQYTSYRTPLEDQIVVLEAWKLPTNSKASDGRHVISIENLVLKEEPYTRNKFPFVTLRYRPPIAGGYYGHSGVEDLTGYQIRLNELNDDIRMGQHVMCTPQIWIQQGTQIVKSQLDTQIGKIITVRGELPEPKVWTAFSAEIYNERDRVSASAYKFFGVSEMSSQSSLPTQARLDSSEAIREFSTVEQTRFSRLSQSLEDFYIEAAHHIIEAAAELYKNHEVNRKQFYRSRYLIQQIDWDDVDMEADKYVLQISASSIMNMTPAARRDKLNEWAAAGVITQQEYKAWSGEPDLEAAADLMSAPKDYIEFVIDKLLKGETPTPDPLMDLQLAFRTVHDSYQHLCSLQDEDDTGLEAILQGFRDYLELIEGVLNPPPDPMMAAAPAAGAPMGGDPMTGMPPGPGMAPPIPPPIDPMANPMGDPSMVTQPSPVSGAPVPAISMPAANSFVGQ